MAIRHGGLRWLEGQIPNIAKGLDAMAEDLVKSVRPYTKLLRHLSSSKTPLYPDDLQIMANMPQSKISEGLDVLEKYRLVDSEGGRYSANDFGRHVLGVVDAV